MIRTLLIALFLFLSVFLLPGSSFAAVRTLSVGLSGSDVTAVQNELIAQGYLASGLNTGHFGPATLAAVQKFQCAKNIVCAGSSFGIVGPMTQSALANDTITNTPTTTNPTTPTSPSTGGILTGKSLSGPATGRFEISGWMPDWRASSSTKDVLSHLNQLTSVMPFGFNVSSSGHLIDSAHITEEPWVSFIAAAKQQKVRVIPTVGWGDGVAIDNILSNSTSRVALEDEIAKLVIQSGFDGIDIDFEAKQVNTRDNFSTFLKGLYLRLPNKFLYCAIEARAPLMDRYSLGTTPPPDATDYANDYVAINKYCDRVEIMAYDQSTTNVRLDAARSAPYAPVADPDWVSDVVNLAAQNISKNKIIIGVPTYGYEYQVTPVGGKYQYDRLWAFNPDYAIKIAARLNIIPHRTSADEIGFTYDPNILTPPADANITATQQSVATSTVVSNQGSQVSTGGPFNYVTWSDAKAIANKVELAHQLGVRGIAVFSLGGAEDPAMWSVLK